MPYAPVDINSIKMDQIPAGFVPVDPDALKMDGDTGGAHFGPPTQSQQFMASPLGGVLDGMESGIIGGGQLIPRVISNVASLGGNFPNVVSKHADNVAALEDNTQRQVLQDRSKALQASGYDPSKTDYSQIAGNILSPENIPITMASGGMAPAASLAGRIGQGVATGMAYAAPAPVDMSKGGYWDQKLGQEEVGAASGGIAPIAGEAIGRLLKPALSPEAKLLQDAGVNLTWGQKSGGWAKSVEDRLTSVPIVGDIIKNAQGRSIEDLNATVANRALDPIGEALPKGVSGRDAVSYVKQKLGDAYNSLLPKLSGDLNDPQFAQELGNLKSMAQSGLPAQEQNTFSSIISRELEGRAAPNGKISGQSLKEAETAIGQKIKDFSASTDGYQRQLLGALKETQNSLRGMIERQNPGYAGELQKINEGYANYARLRTAAGYQGATDGVFTPAQLSAAVRAQDKTVGHGGFATGNAYMQDLSDAAKKVLPSKYPDSGTAGRYLMAAMLGKEGVAGIPMAIGAGIPAAALYSKSASKMAEALAARPESFGPIAQGVKKFSNPAAVARLLAGGK